MITKDKELVIMVVDDIYNIISLSTLLNHKDISICHAFDNQ